MTASPDEEMLILQKKYYIQLLMPKEAPIAVSTEMAILRITFHVSFLIIIVSYALKIYVSVVASLAALSGAAFSVTAFGVAA